jgi:arylsulfatase A-like enzyme
MVDKRLGPTPPEDLTRWLGEPRDGPFFLYLHYIQPHSYRWPPEFDAIAGPRPPGIRDMANGKVLYEVTFDLRAGKGHVTKEEAQYLRRCYDATVAYADKAVGGMFDLLRGQGLWSDTLVIVFADHGEEFAEHGFLQHSCNLYREQLAVPLIIKLPGEPRGRSWPQFARNVDILPTIADVAGVEPRPEWRGTSLLSGETPMIALAELLVRPLTREFFAERTRHWRAVYLASGESLIENGYTAELELYSADDLRQQHDIADDSPHRVRELARLLPTAEEFDAAPLSDEDKKALRALGYLR